MKSTGEVQTLGRTKKALVTIASLVLTYFSEFGAMKERSLSCRLHFEGTCRHLTQSAPVSHSVYRVARVCKWDTAGERSFGLKVALTFDGVVRGVCARVWTRVRRESKFRVLRLGHVLRRPSRNLCGCWGCGLEVLWVNGVGSV